MARRKRILVLFPQEWDDLAFAQPEMAERYEFVRAGFDLFKFPDNARLLTFDARRFVDKLVAAARRKPIDGVLSTNEQFGALIAAVLARRLGLPGADPEAIVTAQHKYYARQALARTAPEATPAFAVFPYTVRHAAEVALPFPFFVKPVKATFSVLARRVDNFAQLRRHLSFRPFEQHIIKRLVKPFNDLMRDHPQFAIDAHHLVAEGLVDGMQVNVDGYVENGDIRLIGIVDEIMYPGTNAFNRFEYPTLLSTALRERISDIATRTVAGVGLRHGFFNVELCADPRTGAVKVIEINPRLASQFATLYQWVDGIDVYQMLIDLALGEPVRYAPQRQRFGRAGSFIFRKFDGVPVSRPPTGEQVRALRQRYPEAHLMLYLKHGASLAREMKWLGSHRFAIVNLPGRDLLDLHARCMDVHALLGFDRETEPSPVLVHGGGFGPMAQPKPAMRESG